MSGARLPREGRCREGGGVALLTMLGGLLMLAVAVVVVGSVIDLATARHQASAAADAAALAAAGASPLAGGDGQPRVAAQRLAGANGASLTHVDDGEWPLRVTVRVEVPTRTALLRALVPAASAAATAELRPP